MPPILAPYNFTLHYRQSASTYRVWRGDWSGDQFEVLNEEQFATLRATGIFLSEHDDSDD